MTALITAIVLFFLNVPGQYVAHVGLPLTEEEYFGREMVHERLEHGWPWTYLVRDDKFFVDRPGEAGYRSTAVWSFNEDFRWFAPVKLLADVVVALVTIVIVAALAERWRRKRRAVWQLRVIDLLGLTAIVALATWFGLTTMRDYQRELTAMRKLGLRVEEDGHPRSEYPDFSWRTRSGPTWLRTAIGDERFPRWFDRLLYAEFPEGDLEQLRAFKHLRAISLMHEPAKLPSVTQLDQLEAIAIDAHSEYWPRTDAAVLGQELARHLAALADLPNLWLFQAAGDGVGDRAANVIASFPHLRVINLAGSSITDAALIRLSERADLEELRLRWTRITDAGVAHLVSLSNLHTLDLRECLVTDACLEDVGKLSKLRCLWLDMTKINGSGLDKLSNLHDLMFISLPDIVNQTALEDLKQKRPSLRILVLGEEFPPSDSANGPS